MKITKRQLRRIIREERVRLLKEQDQPLDDDIQYAAGQVAGSLFDALEELGAGPQAATSITHALKTTAWLDEALDRTLNDYLKKLKMMGGIPKPRSV
jgi:alpha-ketoglutarate-dependent taurine dioxygenase